jgi:O-antigen/teichoic acid export membrane protein
MFGRNLLAGLISSVWSALLGLAVIPLYLRYLGVEAYGLIGFFATTQAMFQLLDMGLTPTLNREIAKCSAPADWQAARRLLHTLACLYAGMAVVIALVVYAAAPLVATRWLQARHLSLASIEHTVVLLGVVIACRWPVGLYQGALIGAQRMTVSSAINVAMTTASTFGAVAILAWVSPTIEAFFIWQAGVGAVHALLMRHAAWHAIGRDASCRFDAGALKRIWRFSAGMSAIALLGLVLTQIDKVLLSKILDLATFGHYMLAVVVVSGLYVLVTPTFNAIYPRFAGLAAARQTESLTALYSTATRGLAVMLFPVAMFLAVLGHDVVWLWTGNAAIAAEVAPVIAMLAIGSALHGIVHVPHALQIGSGMTRLPLTINTIIIVILVPLTIVLALRLGALGGALAWLVLSILYLLLTASLTSRHLVPKSALPWLLRDVGVPLLVSACAGALLLSQQAVTRWSPVLNVSIGLAVMVAAWAAGVALTPALRRLAIARPGSGLRLPLLQPRNTGSSS